MISYGNVPDLVDIVTSGGIYFVDPDATMLLIVTDQKLQDKETYILYRLSLKSGANFILHPKIGSPGDQFEASPFKRYVDRFTRNLIAPIILHVRFAPDTVIKGETIYIGINEGSFFPGTLYGKLELRGYKWLYPRNDHVTASVLMKNVVKTYKKKEGLVACIALNEMGMKNLVEMLKSFN